MERFSEKEALMSKTRAFSVKWSSYNVKRLAVILGLICVCALILALTLNVTSFKKHHQQATSHTLTNKDTGSAGRFQSAVSETDYIGPGPDERHSAVSGTDYIGPGPDERHSAHGSYLKAAVASDHQLCSDIGKDALKKGGSAVDAAIATAVCLGAVNMFTSGLGGAGVMIIYERPRNSTDYELIVLDFLAVAPLAATSDMFNKDPTAKDKGPLSIGVPGEVRGYGAAWERFGRLEWEELFSPTIKMCREGFQMGRAQYEAAALRHPDIVLSDPGLREGLTYPDGSFLKEGDILRLPKLANALEQIVNDGPDTLYTGSLAREMVADIQDLGGIITMEDLRLYKPKWRTPASRFIRNGKLTVYGCGAPGAGSFLQFILDVMSEYNYRPGMVDTEDNQVLFLHRMIETWKMGWGQFQQLEDPDFADEHSLSVISNFDTHDFALESFENINDTIAQRFGVYNPVIHAKQHKGSTTSLSIYTEEGAGVVLTTSIDDYFGSGLRGRRTGIVFNNLMELFNLPGVDSEIPNSIVPGKRASIHMSPTMVFDQSNRPVLLIGASGGRKLVAGLSQVFANTLWFGMAVSDAVDQPRIAQEPPPDLLLNHDQFISQDVLNGLTEKGHTEQQISEPYTAVVQAIDTRTCTCRNRAHAYDTPCIHAVSDFRKYGVPAGY